MSRVKYTRLVRSVLENMRTAYTMSVGRGVVVRKTEGFLGGHEKSPKVCVGYVGQPSFAHDFEFFLGDKTTRSVLSRETLFYRSALSARMHGSDVARFLEGCDVVVFQDYFKKRPNPEALYFSPYLRAVLPLCSSMEQQLASVPSKSHRQRMRKISRSGYTWEKSVSIRDCVSFYNHFYKPHAEHRFGAQAHTESLDDVVHVFQKGGVLVWLKKGDERVACGMLVPSVMADGSMLYYRNGFFQSHAKTSLELGDMNAALEYAVIDYGIQSCVRAIDFDLTLAYASDGVFTHKRRLGCVFEEASYSPSFSVGVQGGHALKVLEAFPLVGRIKGEMSLLMAYQGMDAPEEEWWKSHVRNVLFEGLDHVRVCVQPSVKSAVETLSTHHFGQACRWSFASL